MPSALGHYPRENVVFASSTGHPATVAMEDIIICQAIISGAPVEDNDNPIPIR